WQGLREGGLDNALGFFALIGHAAFGIGPRPAAPRPLPPVMPYTPAALPPVPAQAPAALLLFYRAHLQAGNTAAFDALMAALAEQGLRALALAVDSLKNPSSLATVRALAAEQGVGVVLNATSFAVAALGGEAEAPAEAFALAGDAPV